MIEQYRYGQSKDYDKMRSSCEQFGELKNMKIKDNCVIYTYDYSGRTIAFVEPKRADE